MAQALGNAHLKPWVRQGILKVDKPTVLNEDIQPSVSLTSISLHSLEIHISRQ